ncbi:MAG: VWA domain-containing protein, partial [Terriglobia bacterium]
MYRSLRGGTAITQPGNGCKVVKPLTVLLLLAAVCGLVLGQAGRRQNSTTQSGVLVSVVVKRDDNSSANITSKQLSVYDNGVEQTIKNLTPDPSPARIVLLVDNSLTLRADIDKLERATREFAYEIYEGDQLLIVGYDEEAEIVADWTDSAKSIEAALKGFRKKGQPHLFDALSAVVEQALSPLAGQKRAIVVISDGLDRGSKTTFEKILSELQANDITVYTVQIPDRTRGAIRRDVPKPKQVVEKLVEGTGGLVFSIDETVEAAKSVCDELRKNRYVLSYVPSSVPYGEARRLLVVGDQGITIRSKSMQPPN